MEQQVLINRIYELAIAISISAHTFIDVRYDGTANQLQITVINRKGLKQPTDYIDLPEIKESEHALRRINRQLLEAVTRLESLKAKPLQRSFSL